MTNFYCRCKEAYELIEGYLNDDLGWGLVPDSKKGFKFNPEVRKNNKIKIQQTISIFQLCLDKYSLLEIAISYNGGKDCLVMLVLLLYSIYQKSLQVQKKPLLSDKDQLFTEAHLIDFKLDSVYINSELPFEELSEFIEESTAYYNLNQVTIKLQMKQGFEQYLESNTRIKTIIVGIRFTDPYGANLRSEQMTDHNWPKFIRIHPILHWNYVDIWDLLIGCDLKYCPMYDKGYTSLGGADNTTRNPYLEQKDTSFLPAYMMIDDADNHERLGRNNP